MIWLQVAGWTRYLIETYNIFSEVETQHIRNYNKRYARVLLASQWQAPIHASLLKSSLGVEECTTLWSGCKSHGQPATSWKLIMMFVRKKHNTSGIIIWTMLGFYFYTVTDTAFSSATSQAIKGQKCKALWSWMTYQRDHTCLQELRWIGQSSPEPSLGRAPQIHRHCMHEWDHCYDPCHVTYVEFMLNITPPTYTTSNTLQKRSS